MTYTTHDAARHATQFNASTLELRRTLGRHREMWFRELGRLSVVPLAPLEDAPQRVRTVNRAREMLARIDDFMEHV